MGDRYQKVVTNTGQDLDPLSSWGYNMIKTKGPEHHLGSKQVLDLKH